MSGATSAADLQHGCRRANIRRRLLRARGPTFSQSRNVGHKHARAHHIAPYCAPAFVERRLDIPQRLHRLRVAASPRPTIFPFASGRRRPRHMDVHAPRAPPASSPTIGSHGAPLEMFSRLASCRTPPREPSRRRGPVASWPPATSLPDAGTNVPVTLRSYDVNRSSKTSAIRSGGVLGQMVLRSPKTPIISEWLAR